MIHDLLTLSSFSDNIGYIGGSKISEKGVHIVKVFVSVCQGVALLILSHFFFINILCKSNTETKSFHLLRILKKQGSGRGARTNPLYPL